MESSSRFVVESPAEKNGDWLPAERETAQDLTRLKQSFPTPRDAVSYIMDTFPIVRRKDQEKFNGAIQKRYGKMSGEITKWADRWYARWTGWYEGYEESKPTS